MTTEIAEWRRRTRSRAISNMRCAAIAALAIGSAACSTLDADSSAEDKVGAVTERATARWRAIIDKDFDAAYAYLSPASRATLAPGAFRTIASRLAYRAARVEQVVCERTSCTVKLELTYDTPKIKRVRTLLEESWIIDKGQAWYVWPL